jgi:magnesium-transporting ATPase (P-type)
MDTLAALALATEPPQESILKRQPYHKDAPIVTEVMWRNVFGHAIYQMIVIVVIIFAWPGLGLVHPYDQLVLEEGKFNPYYAKTHYIEQDDISEWTALSYTPD